MADKYTEMAEEAERAYYKASADSFILTAEDYLNLAADTVTNGGDAAKRSEYYEKADMYFSKAEKYEKMAEIEKTEQGAKKKGRF